METILKIAELISSDIRLRSNASIIRKAIEGIEGGIVLDFAGVTFISRSFADELYNVMQENKNISLNNKGEVVSTMMEAVETGRKTKRVYHSEDAEMIVCNDMESLSKVLSTF